MLAGLATGYERGPPEYASGPHMSDGPHIYVCPPTGARAMPKARAPLDYDRYQELHRQGLSQRLIAKELGIAESTLRDNLRVLQKAQASHGLPQGDQGPPQGNQGGRTPNASLRPPQLDEAETAILSSHAPSTPHLGVPEDTEGVPHQGTPNIHQGGPPAMLSAQDVQDLQALLAWWRDRHRLVQDAAAPERQLERQTYHIEKRFIEAVRREADLTGESYAAIVNRALAQYFAGKST